MTATGPPPDLNPSVTSQFSIRSSGTAPSARPVDPGVVTLTGWVGRGVEHGCVVLLDSTGTVLANLVGLPDRSPGFGTEVQVNGRFVTGMISFCQQGRPFRVTTIAVRTGGR